MILLRRVWRYQKDIQKKNRQHNGKKYKKINNDLQIITIKTEDQVTETPLKPRVNSGAPEGYAVPAPLVAHVVLILLLSQ